MVAIAINISLDNPWWKSKDKIHEDIKIKDWKESKIKWDPKIRRKFDYSNDIVYSLQGPRQVGKTTMIKLQIKEFLDDGISPWNIFYYPFDLETDPKDIVRIVTDYLDKTSRQRGNMRSYLFLDEISSIKHWEKGIKRLWDLGRLKNCTIIVTGSHSIDLNKSSEKLPGRRGETGDRYDKIMLPMKFSEYVRTLDNDLSKILDKDFNGDSRLEIFQKLFDLEIDARLDELSTYSSELDRYLTNYLLTGGIPKVIDDYLKNGFISEQTYTTYLHSILGDLNSLNRSPMIFKQIVINIIEHISWPRSWTSIQKDTEVSWSTVVDYVTLLADMFVLGILYNYDSKRKTAALTKDKKIHFRDVFFLHALNSWDNPEKSFDISQIYINTQANRGKLIEGIVGDHLIRLAFFLSLKKQIFDYQNNLFYWKPHKDQEVDYILKSQIGSAKIEIPIEVKYQKNITTRDIYGIINFKRLTGARSGLLVSNDQLDLTSECIKIPASMFLVLI